MVIIRSDSDIRDFIIERGFDNIVYHDLKYIYKMPGYRSYFHLGRHNSDLFIEIIANRILNIQSKWHYPMSLFIETLNSFGCKDTFFLDEYEDITYIKHSLDFDVYKEDLLIEKFLNMLIENKDYMKSKYGLR